MTLYRVTAQSLEVLAASAADIRVSAQSIEALVATYEVRVPKAVGYAVLSSTGDTSVAVAKAVGYAVLDSGTSLSVAKAVAYAVLHDPSVSTIDRRRPVIMSLS